MENEKYFSEEYQNKTDFGTDKKIENAINQEQECKKDEFERYGISKPYRIKLKAKKVDDKS